MKNTVALETYLKLFKPFFEMEQVTEICINRPYEIWIEQKGQFKSYTVPAMSYDFLWKFAQLVAEANDRQITPEYPSLSAKLPNGLRIQFVIEPACEQGSFVCAIRQKAMYQTTIKDYCREGLTKDNGFKDSTNLLSAYRRWVLTSDAESFLKLAVLHRKNIIISGGTSTGKTTLLNAVLGEIPERERLITIETDREVNSSHPNKVHLLAVEEGKSVSTLSMLDVLKASLRLRPDRIIVSELRAEEAFPYLRAINSGHPGSITTMHADCPLSCFDQLAFMVIQGNTTLSKQEVIDYAKSIVNIIVQVKRTSTGERFISDIYFDEIVKTQNKNTDDNNYKFSLDHFSNNKDTKYETDFKIGNTPGLYNFN